MVRGAYWLLSCTLTELLQCNIWWLEGLELINNGFTNNKALELHCKGIQQVGDIWDKDYHTFISWEDALTNFSLTTKDYEEWVKLTTLSSINGGTCWREMLRLWLGGIGSDSTGMMRKIPSLLPNVQITLHPIENNNSTLASPIRLNVIWLVLILDALEGG